MSSAVDRLQNMKITGYALLPPNIIYFGSFLWMMILIGLKLTLLNLDSSKSIANITPILWTCIGLNIWTFVWQTIDVLYFDFSNWIIIAMHWVSQLSTISIAGTILSLCAAVSDSLLLVLGLLLVVSEALFTASQFSVTLEYLHKASANPTLPIIKESAKQTRASLRSQ